MPGFFVWVGRGKINAIDEERGPAEGRERPAAEGGERPAAQASGAGSAAIDSMLQIL
jgi:hypothetical protein